MPYLWPKWWQNGQDLYPIYDQNGWKNNVLFVFVRDLNTDSTVTMDSDFHNNNNFANASAGKKRRMADDNQQVISQVWENCFFFKWSCLIQAHEWNKMAVSNTES